MQMSKTIYRRFTRLAIFFSLAWLAALPLAESAGKIPGSDDYAPGEVLVKFRTQVAAATCQAEAKKFHTVDTSLSALHSALLTQKGLKEKDTITALQVKRLLLSPNQSLPETLQHLKASPLVEYAEPNYQRIAMAPLAAGPNDLGYQQGVIVSYRKNFYESVTQLARQWWLEDIEADRAYAEDIIHSQNQIIIAILDTGIYLTHEDFSGGRLVPGRDYYNSYNVGDDDSTGQLPFWEGAGHGTHVAGIAAALVGNSYTGVAGTAYLDNIKLMPVKVLDSAGSGWDYDICDGVIWAADHDARVINLSLAGASQGISLEKAIVYAYQKGCVVIAAAGNAALDGNPVMYPAAFDQTIAVGACDSNGARCNYSSYHDYVDIAAPGGSLIYAYQDYWAQAEPAYQMLSTLNNRTINGLYGTMAGTSMAAPVVAGVAAMLLAQNPNRSPEEIANIITTTADKVGNLRNDADGWNKELGWGRVNLYKALKQVSSYTAKSTGRPSYNYPNPFKPAKGEKTYIVIPLSAGQPITAADLNIYDAAGRLVRHLHLGSSQVTPGGIIVWDGRNGNNEMVANGIYPYVLEVGGKTYQNKIAVLN